MFRRRLRLSAAAGASLLIAASAAVLAAPTAIASPAAEDPVVNVAIDSFTPAAPKPGDAVVITGRITNTSSSTFDNAQATACIDDHLLTTAAELAAIPTEADEPVQRRNSCVGLNDADSATFQEFDQPVAPKATVPFRLVVRWQDWHIDGKTGVYAVGVRFRGNITPKDRVSAGLSRILMPVVSADPMPRKVNTAVVIPLLHRPTLLGGDRFANDSLAESLAPTGELGRLLALGQKEKVSWLVDPAMLDEVKQMARGYRVVGSNNEAKPGTGQKAAAAWLKAFDLSRAKNPTILLPYGDPDISTLIDAGGTLRDLVGQARTATEQYNLGGPPLFRSGLWLENGSASSKNLATASTGYAGAKADDINLVSSSSWSAETRPSLSPSPVYDVLTPEGPVKSVRTVVANSSLTAGGPDPASATSALQVQQRFAAETSLLASTGTGPITVVALPPRGWDPDGRSTTGLVQGLSLPWITPVNLDQVIPAGKPVTPAPKVIKAPAAQRSSGALAGAQLEQFKNLNNATTTFVSLLNNPDAADENLRRALFRAGSNSWKGYADEAQRFTAFELTAVNGQLGKVHLVTNAGAAGREIKVNLSGSKGTFPLTIANELNVSVRVGIVVTSANRSDLRIEPLETKVLAAGVKATYQINASAEQNGLILAEAQVVSAQQLPVGRSQQLVIQAAQYGSVGWILVGAAVALLFGTSIVRIYRRIRSERRNPSSPEPGSDPLHPAPLDPGDLGTATPVPQVADNNAEPNPLDPVKPLRITTDRANGVRENTHAEEDGAGAPHAVPGQSQAVETSRKEGVGTKDG